MDDESNPQESSDKASESNSLDLSALNSFSFGTEWSKSDSKDSNRRGGSGQRSERSPSSGRRPRGDRPDRRSSGGSSQGGGARADRRPQFRRDAKESGSGDRRRQGGGEFRGRGRPQNFQTPYESSVFEVSFYPEDNSFAAIIKAMRANHLTYELFEVSKLFLEKPERYIASIACKKTEKGEDKAAKVFMSLPDSMPFASEDEAIQHAVSQNPESFFKVEEVEVDPPSGNFQFVNRCPFTKVLLGPPNYHRYEQTLRQHHSTKVAHMSFEKLQSSIETVRDEEVVNEWLESTRKITRYMTIVEEGQDAQSFDTLEEAVIHVKLAEKLKAVKAVNYARVAGTVLEKFKGSEAARAAEGELARQNRFPLNTANAIRGRMRREKFSIYKKGSKGVTYICATKRNFRSPGQVMAPALDRIIRFLEAHSGVKLRELSAPYEEWLKTDAPGEAFDEKKLFRDMHWLVADGYVSHFSDDKLTVQGVLENTPKEAKTASAKPEKTAEPTPAASAVKEAKADEPKAPTEMQKEATADAAAEEKPAVSADPETADASEEPIEAKAEETETVTENEAKAEVAEVEEVMETAPVAEVSKTEKDSTEEKKD